MVVLPEPDGAENIISLPFSMNKDNSFFLFGHAPAKEAAGSGFTLQSFTSHAKASFVKGFPFQSLMRT
jgi:hypothetical protein